MAADTAGGGLTQLETHYQTFMVSLFVTHSFVELVLIQADRGRLCRNGWCWFELGSHADPLLGDRRVRWRTFPCQDMLEVRSSSISKIIAQ
jgi:hypothetical protein